MENNNHICLLMELINFYYNLWMNENERMNEKKEALYSMEATEKGGGKKDCHACE